MFVALFDIVGNFPRRGLPGLIDGDWDDDGDDDDDDVDEAKFGIALPSTLTLAPPSLALAWSLDVDVDEAKLGIAAPRALTH